MSVSLIGRCSIDQAEALSAKVALPWSCLHASAWRKSGVTVFQTIRRKNNRRSGEVGEESVTMGLSLGGARIYKDTKSRRGAGASFPCYA
jgi:hypothetical protein